MLFQLPPAQIHITALRQTADATQGSVTYEGDVVVEYRGSRILADRITTYNAEQRGVAEGKVVVLDPSGTLNADRLEIGWNPAHKFETAFNATIRVRNGILKARRAEIGEGDWQLYDVEGTTAFSRKPIYYVTSDHVTVSATKQATIHQPRLSILGRYIAQLPTQRVSLIKAVPSIGYPAPAYNKRRGVGLTWTGGLLVGRQETFNFNATAYANRRASGLAQYTYSFLPLDRATQVVVPKSDFGERFSNGYLTNVRIVSPFSEDAYLRAAKSSLSFGGQLNGSVSGRDRGDQYSKIESLYEVGGAQGKFGYLAQARLQGIKQEYDDLKPRLELIGTLKLPTVDLQRGLQLISRIDSDAFGGETGYAWLQGTSGLTFSPVAWLRLSAGGYFSGDVGTPEFAMDPLYAKRGVLTRSDLHFGGLNFSYLIKHDFGRGAFDHEFSLRQVIGPFEAFYSKREYPHGRNVGIMLNIQPFSDAFRQRFAEATGKPIPASPKR